MEATLRIVEQPGQKLKFRQVAHSHKCQSAELMYGRVGFRVGALNVLYILTFIFLQYVDKRDGKIFECSWPTVELVSSRPYPNTYVRMR